MAVVADLYHFDGEQDSDMDPHQREMLDPDQHQIERRIRICINVMRISQTATLVKKSHSHPQYPLLLPSFFS
jgi:hypothetical protein